MVQVGMEDDGNLVPFPRPASQQPDHGDSFVSNDGDASSLGQQSDQDDSFISDDDDDNYSSLDEQSDDEDNSSSSMSDDGDYSSLDEQSDSEDDDGSDDSSFMSDGGSYSSLDEQSDEDDDDIFMANLMGAIRSFTSDGFQAPGGAGDPAVTYSEQYYIVRLAPDNDGEEEEYGLPVHAPPAAASEAAIAALEAAEAPADDCCPVCLQDGAGGGAWRRVAPCGHRFHAACVGQWLRVKLSCPVCRCPAAAAPPPAACRRDSSAEPQLPLPEIVEEMLVGDELRGVRVVRE